MPTSHAFAQWLFLIFAWDITEAREFADKVLRFELYEQAVRSSLDWHCDGTPEADMSPAELTVIKELQDALGLSDKTIEEIVQIDTQQKPR